MNNDYMLRLAEAIGKFAGKILFHKNEKEYENINLNSISTEGILPIILKKLVLEGKYNEAENILFEELHKNSSNEVINIGKDFYDMLLSKSDEELMKAGFSREEISQGLKDMEKFSSH